MKRIIPYIVMISLLLAPFTPIVNARSLSNDADDYGEFQRTQPTEENLETEPTSEYVEYAFLSPSNRWNKLVQGEAPAQFSTVSYELQDHVLMVGQEVTANIASRTQLISGSTIQNLRPRFIVAEGGYVPMDILDTAASQAGRQIDIGTIVVDETSGTAFKVVAPTSFDGLPDLADGAEGIDELWAVAEALDGTYSITRPQLHEVLKDFSLGGTSNDGETITLTRGNITGFAENVEKNVVDPSGFQFLALENDYNDFEYLDSPLVSFKFEDEQLDGWLEDGSKIKIGVTGGIAVGNMSLNAKYSGFNGYRIALSIAEESYLHVDMKAIGKQEVKIPIIGIGVDLGVGSISGGVFIVVGLDGKMRLEIGAREYAKASIGVKGSTKLYIPTSVHPLYGLESFKGDGDLAMSGAIKGYLKFGPEMGLEIFGFDLVGASAYLGTGANVQEDGYLLDVELYGIMEAKAHFAGERFNLISARPTIVKRKQASTGNYVVSFMEVFIVPSRVGGIIKEQSSDLDTPDMPVEGIEYRILVVPENETFNPNIPGDIDKSSIRKYPATGYDTTNAEGEFFYEDETNEMLYNGDKVYLEFRDAENHYFSQPQSPTFEFERMEIYSADYFNDFVTGQVMPIRIINWAATPADPLEEQYETSYYSNMPVTISHHGVAVIMTDETGQFDTRVNIPENVVNNLDVQPPTQGSLYTTFLISINHNGAVTTTNRWFAPTLTMTYNRIVEEVPNSFSRKEENGKIIDSVTYKEYIWFMNPYGTRTFTENELIVDTWGISSVDDPARGHPLNPNYSLPYLGGVNPVTVSDQDSYILTPVLDINGNETGTSVLAREITAEWVWQAHKNPVKITSPDHGNYTTNGGQFLITASGYAPFLFTLEDAPAGVKLGIGTDDKVSMTIPAGLAEKEYQFTIRAEEDRSRTPSWLNTTAQLFNLVKNDYYEGNDPSPPDEQMFTLTITKGTNVPVEDPEEPDPPLVVEPPEEEEPPTEEEPPIEEDPPVEVLVQPEILVASHGYDFTVIEGEESSSVLVKASGSTPISWSLISIDSAVPDGVAIGSLSGVMTFSKTIEAGIYEFSIKAENEAGFDLQACKLIVKEAAVAPTILAEEHGYDFSKFDDRRDFNIQISATGSTPIEWSLMATRGYEMPVGVTINYKTGLLSISGQVGEGIYYFTIKAANEAGSDTQACKLTVQRALRTAPTIVIEDHGYAFLRTASDKDLDVQISATGSTPIEWSIIPTSGYRLPEGITIDAETGLLTFHGGIAVGTYYFTIKAANAVGSDTQECSLVVRIGFGTLSTDNGLSLLAAPLSPDDQPTFSFSQEEPLEFKLLAEEMPAITSSIVIRCDDARDVYTNDRFIYNGAKYIRWEPSFRIGVEGSTTIKYLYDSAPWCLKYHYKDSFIPYNAAEIIAQLVKEIAGEIHINSSDFGIFNGEPINRQDLESEFDNKIVNPLDNRTTYLEYGALLEAMNVQGRGSFLVELDAYTGALVPGDYFMGLMKNPKAELTFQQEGVGITFTGNSVKNASEYDMFNFEYSPEAFHASEILEKIGAGGENFTFAFQHHGQLPGMATFTIDTDITDGSQVNVYRFDSENSQFILIGQDLLVGAEGVVTYKNNTMSDYLVTTKELPEAMVSEVADLQGGEDDGFLGVMILGLVAILAIITLYVVINRRRSVE